MCITDVVMCKYKIIVLCVMNMKVTKCVYIITSSLCGHFVVALLGVLLLVHHSVFMSCLLSSNLNCITSASTVLS